MKITLLALALALALAGCSAPAPYRDLTPAEEIAIWESLDNIQLPPR